MKRERFEPWVVESFGLRGRWVPRDYTRDDYYSARIENGFEEDGSAKYEVYIYLECPSEWYRLLEGGERRPIYMGVFGTLRRALEAVEAVDLK